MTPDARRRWRRFGAAALVVAAMLAVLSIAGLWAAHHLLAPEKLKALIETSASKFLQRKLTIESVERAPFPKMELRATGVKLADADGRLLVDSPIVVAKASVRSLFLLRLGVEELRFEEPRIDVWFERDGRTNVEKIISDIQNRPKAGVKRSVGSLLFHRFKIVQGLLSVADVPGAPPAVRGRANGEITLKFSPLGLRAPFELSVIESDEGAQVRVTGQAGSSPQISVRAQRLPARALSRRVRAVENCDGVADVRLDWTGGRKTAVEFGLSPSNLCSGEGALPERLSGFAKRERGGWALEVVAVGSGTNAALRGKIPAAPAPVKLALSGASIDFDSLIAWTPAGLAIFKRATAGEKPSRPAAPRALEMTVALASFTARGVTMSDVGVTVSRSTTSVVRADPAAASVFGGRAVGILEFRDDVFTLEARGNDWEIDQVAAVFGSTDNFSGRASIQLNGSTPLGSPVISSFTGRAEIWIENLEMMKVPAVLVTLASANLVRLADEVRGDKSADFPPAKGRAKAELSNGVAQVSEAVLENRTLRFGYTGAVDYKNKALNGTAVLHALTLPDQIINDIPFVRKLLLGDGKSFLPLWFRITGPWHQPQVRPQPAKSLSSPIRTFFEGLLDLPQDVIDAVRGK